MQISLTDARQVAQAAAESNLKPFASDADVQILREEFLEGENCWFFFKNPKIIIPPEKALKADWAYAVSKHGQIREIPDFFDDKERLISYLKTMSDFFGRK